VLFLLLALATCRFSFSYGTEFGSFPFFKGRKEAHFRRLEGKTKKITLFLVVLLLKISLFFIVRGRPSKIMSYFISFSLKIIKYEQKTTGLDVFLHLLGTAPRSPPLLLLPRSNSLILATKSKI
jgi:hypothetical protein